MMIAGNLWAVIEDTQKEFGFWIAVRKEVHRSFQRAFDLSIDAVTGCTIMGLRTTRFGEKFYNPPYTRQDSASINSPDFGKGELTMFDSKTSRRRRMQLGVGAATAGVVPVSKPLAYASPVGAPHGDF